MTNFNLQQMKKSLGLLCAILISSCGNLDDMPDEYIEYGILERCNIDVRFNTCECSQYDFNYPKPVGDFKSFSIDECLEKFETAHIFSTKQWGEQIVVPRKVRKFLEDSRSKKELKKRVKSLKD